MAASMFVLLFTAFLPVVGVQFAWVTWHWIAGLVLTGSILFHIIHASFWLDFWSIWVGPKDIPEIKAELLRELGHDVPGPKSGKYPLGNRLYHMAIVVAGLSAVLTGVLMMSRVRTPIFTRNPYLFGDGDLGRDLRRRTVWRAWASSASSSRTSTSPSGPRSGGSPSRCSSAGLPAGSISSITSRSAGGVAANPPTSRT